MSIDAKGPDMLCPFCSEAIASPDAHRCATSRATADGHAYYSDGARRPSLPGFFGEDRSRRVDTSWLTETPPGQAAYSAPAEPQSPATSAPPARSVPVEQPIPEVEAVEVVSQRRRVHWAGMPGRVSTARWSLGRTIAGTVPVVAVVALLSVLGWAWLFGTVTWWAAVPAVAGGLLWLVIAVCDAARYAMRGGPAPPIL